ncbi:unnamed protein product [Rhizophagus irregularis]|nr:unnamed protein product [Rhizophagus irregularis]
MYNFRNIHFNQIKLKLLQPKYDRSSTSTLNKIGKKNANTTHDVHVQIAVSYQHWKLSVEWEEIIISEIKPNPKLERPQLELLKKYTLDNTKDLRKVLAEPFVWCTQSKA